MCIKRREKGLVGLLKVFEWKVLSLGWEMLRVFITFALFSVKFCARALVAGVELPHK